MSFAVHVKSLFRQRDQQSVSFALDLWSYDDVRAPPQTSSGGFRRVRCPATASGPPIRSKSSGTGLTPGCSRESHAVPRDKHLPARRRTSLAARPRGRLGMRSNPQTLAGQGEREGVRRAQWWAGEDRGRPHPVHHPDLRLAPRPRSSGELPGARLLRRVLTDEPSRGASNCPGARVHLFVRPEARERFTLLFRDVLGCDAVELDFGLAHPVLLVSFGDGSRFSV